MSEGLLQAPPQSLHNVSFTFGGIDPRYIDKVCTAVGAGDEQSRGNVVGIVFHRDIFAPTSTILESVFALHGQPLSLSFDGYILPRFQKKVKRFFKFTKSPQLTEAPDKSITCGARNVKNFFLLHKISTSTKTPRYQNTT